jgi:hypothetical protein
VIDSLIRNDDIVRISATVFLAARIVGRAPFIEPACATIRQGNPHEVILY